MMAVYISPQRAASTCTALDHHVCALLMPQGSVAMAIDHCVPRLAVAVGAVMARGSWNAVGVRWCLMMRFEASRSAAGAP